MPGKLEILDDLARIANENWPSAVVWHILLGSVLIALFLGWRPNKRDAAQLLILPLLSVLLAAATQGKAFNAALMGATALALFMLGTRLPRSQVTGGSKIERTAGIFGIAFGATYPHFLSGHSTAIYLVAAPVGLLPCPTLAAIIGFALLTAGFNSRSWSTVLAAVGAFYGAFGVFRLGVVLDFGLLGVSLVLLGSAWLPRTSKSHALLARQGLEPANRA